MSTDQRAGSHLKIIETISSAIVATDDIEVVANLTLDLAISHTRAEKASFMLLNKQKELRILAARGLDEKIIRDYRQKVGHGVAGIVAASLRPVLVEDIALDERFSGTAESRYSTRSFISCPIISKKKLLGIVNINDKKDFSPFSENEFAVVKIIANLAATALENAFLLSELQQKAAELAEERSNLIQEDQIKTDFIARISHETRTPLNAIRGSVYYLQQDLKTSTNDHEEFLDIIAKETDQLVSIIDSLINYLRLQDETQILSRSLLTFAEIRRRVNVSHYVKTLLDQKQQSLNWTIESQNTEIVADQQSFYDYFCHVLTALSYHSDYGSTIEISVVENQYLNVIFTSPKLPEKAISYFSGLRPNFSKEHLEPNVKLYLARKIADAHGWQMHAENQNDSFRLTLSIQNSRTKRMEDHTNLVLELFAEISQELLNPDFCSFMLNDRLTGELVTRSIRKDDSTLMPKPIKVGFVERLAAWTAIEGRPFFLSNDSRFLPFLHRICAPMISKAFICIPIMKNDRLLGVLSARTKESGRSAAEPDFIVARIIGQQVSWMLENISDENQTDLDFEKHISSLTRVLGILRNNSQKNKLLTRILLGVFRKLGIELKDELLAAYVAAIHDLGSIGGEYFAHRYKKHNSAKDYLVFLAKQTLRAFNHIGIPEEAKRVVSHQSEYYDGKGRPDGLSGEDIPLISRILCVLNSFRAMISDNCVDKTWKQSLVRIASGAGTKYDPKVVDAFVAVAREHGIGSDDSSGPLMDRGMMD